MCLSLKTFYGIYLKVMDVIFIIQAEEFVLPAKNIGHRSPWTFRNNIILPVRFDQWLQLTVTKHTYNYSMLCDLPVKLIHPNVNLFQAQGWSSNKWPSPFSSSIICYQVCSHHRYTIGFPWQFIPVRYHWWFVIHLQCVQPAKHLAAFLFFC